MDLQKMQIFAQKRIQPDQISCGTGYTVTVLVDTMDKETKLMVAIGLALGFMFIEVIGGFIANSLSIFSDAAHLLTDVAGFGISLVAVLAAKRPGCKDFTYGLLRAEVFGALASTLSLWVITWVLVTEAYTRAVDWFEGRAAPVNGKLMFFVAVFGVLVNVCLGMVFRDEHDSAFSAHSHGGHGHSHGHDHAAGSAVDHGACLVPATTTLTFCMVLRVVPLMRVLVFCR